MPTIIDSLIIRIGINPQGVQQGAQQVNVSIQRTVQTATSAAKQLESRGRQAGMFFSNMRNQALSLIAVLLGGKGIANFATSTAASMTQVGQAAAGLGVAVQDLNAFRMAVEANGGSADAASSALGSLNQSLNEWRVTGKTDKYAFFSEIGANQADTALSAYQKYVAYVERHKGNLATQNYVGQGLGLNSDTVTYARRGSAQIAQDLEAARRRGASTASDTKTMTEFNRALTEMGQAFDGVARAALVRFAPSITSAMKAVTAFVEANGPLTAQMGAIAAAIAGIAVAAPILIKLFGIGGSITMGLARGIGATVTGLLTGLGGLGRMMLRFSPWLAAAGIALTPGDTNAGEREWLEQQRNGAPPPGRPATDDELEKPEFTWGGAFRRLFGIQSAQAAPGAGGGAVTGGIGISTLRDLVGKAEGSDQNGGYNATLANGALTGGQQNLVGMTLGQIDQLQSNMLKHPDNKWNSSAVGRYQITQETMRGLKSSLGLGDNDKYDKATQDRMFDELVRTRVTGTLTQMQDGLARVWASVPTGTTGKPYYANQQRMGATNEETRRALELLNGARSNPGTAAGGGGAQQGASNIDIRQITIQTASADPRAIAREIPAAIRGAQLNYRIS